jgi:hypothetical protein
MKYFTFIIHGRDCVSTALSIYAIQTGLTAETTKKTCTTVTQIKERAPLYQDREINTTDPGWPSNGPLCDLYPPFNTCSTKIVKKDAPFLT